MSTTPGFIFIHLQNQSMFVDAALAHSLQKEKAEFHSQERVEIPMCLQKLCFDRICSINAQKVLRHISFYVNNESKRSFYHLLFSYVIVVK